MCLPNGQRVRGELFRQRLAGTDWILGLKKIHESWMEDFEILSRVCSTSVSWLHPCWTRSSATRVVSFRVAKRLWALLCRSGTSRIWGTNPWPSAWIRALRSDRMRTASAKHPWPSKCTRASDRGSSSRRSPGRGLPEPRTLPVSVRPCGRSARSARTSGLVLLSRIVCFPTRTPTPGTFQAPADQSDLWPALARTVPTVLPVSR